MCKVSRKLQLSRWSSQDKIYSFELMKAVRSDCDQSAILIIHWESIWPAYKKIKCIILLWEAYYRDECQCRMITSQINNTKPHNVNATWSLICLSLQTWQMLTKCFFSYFVWSTSWHSPSSSGTVEIKLPSRSSGSIGQRVLFDVLSPHEFRIFFIFSYQCPHRVWVRS